MLHIKQEVYVACPLEKAIPAFDRRLFEYLAPSFPKLKIVRYEGQHEGAIVALKLGLWPVYVDWISRIHGVAQTQDAYQFEDEGLEVPFPLGSWRHRHGLISSGEGCVVTDEVWFTARYRWLNFIARAMVAAMIRGRKAKYRAYFVQAAKRSA